jgi:hypothetical protein
VSRLAKTMVLSGGRDSGGKGVGLDNMSGGRWGGEVNGVEAGGAVTMSNHNTSCKIPDGEPQGIKLHRATVVSSEVTNREKVLDNIGGNKDVVEVQRAGKDCVTY